MEFLIRSRVQPARLGIFPGSFHPITRAHLALAQTALQRVDEVVFTMPRRFPHKEYKDVGLAARMEIVCAAIAGQRAFSAAITEGGLFIEIARECRDAYGGVCELWMVCGRDAAERIVGWDYGDIPVEMQLEEYGLLVAGREGLYQPPTHLRRRVRHLVVEGWDEVSATEVRRRIRCGKNWEELIPVEAVDLVRRHYKTAPHCRGSESCV